MKLTVTVLDTTGIQSYIFGSNRLRENIGASYLVSQVTSQWVQEALEQLGIPRNQQEQPIEQSDSDAELVYAGGGNAVLLFRESDNSSSDESLAIKFTKILSKQILEQAPGINLVVAHREGFEWERTHPSLFETIQDLMENGLTQKKRSRTPSSPLMGLGVTADCLSTRQVAVDTSDRHDSPNAYLVSREVAAKLDAFKYAHEDLKQKIFDPRKPLKYRVPKDFDDFGRSEGESSYLAVVHADGNSMGKRFQNYGERAKDNREYITQIRRLSQTVNQAGINALKAVAQAVINSIEEDKDEDGQTIFTVLKKFKLYNNQYLPFRPLVYGGDDVTFVCDGRLGLELAILYLQEFEKQIVADGQPLSACAGVSIIKVHYPFARAYELSEDLCKQAKKFAKVDPITKNPRTSIQSALDWHVAATGLFGFIADIRRREYQVPDGSLAMRPVLLRDSDDEWRTWPGFVQIIQEFSQNEWRERKNKVMALREVLRRGPDAVKEFLLAYRLKSLPEFPRTIGTRRKPFAEKGWLDKRCGYFDAIEAIDFYLGLTEINDDQVSTQNSPVE